MRTTAARLMIYNPAEVLLLRVCPHVLMLWQNSSEAEFDSMNVTQRLVYPGKHHNINAWAVAIMV